tara:strand:+ start:10001 stop:10267 length:267 start_codon:yes stop_codon:yes gene_type:complete
MGTSYYQNQTSKKPFSRGLTIRQSHHQLSQKTYNFYLSVSSMLFDNQIKEVVILSFPQQSVKKELMKSKLWKTCELMQDFLGKKKKNF